jgi:hypothetical protein
MSASYPELDMITMNQLQANRLNAQKSTGPRTPAGKEVSRFNALKHGVDARQTVIPGENQADLECLAAEYQDHLCPATAVERYLVDTLILSDWLRRRLQRAQAELYTVLAGRPGIPGPLSYAWQSDAAGSNTLQKVFRQLSTLDRSYLRALTEIRRLKEDSADPESVAEQPSKPQAMSASATPQTGGLGFVSSTPGLAPWRPSPDPDPLRPVPISSTFGRLPNGEPLAVRR